MKKVFVAQHPTEAHLVAGLLESHGISSRVRGEALFSVRGEAPITADTLPSVWVLDDERAREAVDLIAAANPARVSGERRPWRRWACLHCGEMVEPQFTACWKCGADWPGSMSSV